MSGRSSNTFAALADTTWRATSSRLALAETSVNEIAEPFEVSLPAVTKHFKVLQRAGLTCKAAKRNGGFAN